MKRETKSAAIRSLLAEGVTDYDQIIRRLARKGVHVSPSLICHIKNGKIKGAKKITIPYSPFRKSRHADTFYQTLRHLQEWVGDDVMFRRLLREYDSLVKSGATNFLKQDRQVMCKPEVAGRLK